MLMIMFVSLYSSVQAISEETVYGLKKQGIDVIGYVPNTIHDATESEKTMFGAIDSGNADLLRQMLAKGADANGDFLQYGAPPFYYALIRPEVNYQVLIAILDNYE